MVPDVRGITAMLNGSLMGQPDSQATARETQAARKIQIRPRERNGNSFDRLM
jgi:hypothetical protein